MLHKYKSFDDKDHWKKLISEGQLYFADITQLNDLFELYHKTESQKYRVRRNETERSEIRMDNGTLNTRSSHKKETLPRERRTGDAISGGVNIQ